MNENYSNGRELKTFLRKFHAINSKGKKMEKKKRRRDSLKAINIEEANNITKTFFVMQSWLMGAFANIFDEW